MAKPIMTFREAYGHATKRGNGKPSILLGNGFSVDYDSTRFSYSSLAEEASLGALSVSKKRLFKALGTSNFEEAIEILSKAADLAAIYDQSGAMEDSLRNDALAVKRGLADVLAQRHPKHAYKITDDEVGSARTFLANFREVFTLNYDLLLYWVANRSVVGPDMVQSDGFEWPSLRDHSFLVWKRNPSRRQRIHYLHGALHLYVKERRVRKLQYGQDGSVAEQMRENIAKGIYPLVVTEGTSDDKRAVIDRSAYLRTAHHRFDGLSGRLFLHGVSLSENDAHVTEGLAGASSKVDALYVGLHGDPTGRSAMRIQRRAKEIKDLRRAEGGAKLSVRFYNSATANVWR